MTITTKFDKGGVIWFMYSNRAISGKIKDLNGAQSKFPDVIWRVEAKIPYFITGMEDQLREQEVLVCENEMFPTREELVKTI